MDLLQTKIPDSTSRALSFLCDRMPGDYDITRSEWVIMLNEFLQAKGNVALEGLAGFYLWVIRNIKGDEQNRYIKITFSHDLNERNVPTCLPRSYDYAKFWKEEYCLHNPPQKKRLNFAFLNL